MALVSLENSTNGRTKNGFSTLLDGLAALIPVKGAAARAADDFLSPERVVSPPMLPEPGGPSLPLAVPGWPTPLNARVWDGPAATPRPTALLVHGWEGQMYDLGAYVPALLAAGFRVVAFDAPAHGRSFGDRSSLPAMADAVRAVAKAAGPVAAAIGHGLGAAALMLALDAGLDVGRVVLAGTPADPLDPALLCAKAHGLDADETGEMLRIVDRAMPRPLTGISLTDIAGRMTAQALFLHGTDDRVAQVGAMLHVSALWRGARVHLEDGIGHRGTLRDGPALREAVGFVAAAIDPQAIDPSARVG